MLAWIRTLPCLISSILVLTAPQSGVNKGLVQDVRMLIFEKLEFADLYQASYVSEGFRVWADEAIMSLYVIRHGGKAYLNYTSIIHELNSLFADIRMRNLRDMDTAVFNDLPHVSCVRSILEPHFGRCINYNRFNEVCFNEGKVSVHILSDPQKITALPYILDFNFYDSAWIHLIRGLAELKRFDLLGKMAFRKIYKLRFCELMSVSLPGHVLMTAAKSFQAESPGSKLAKLLAFAESGSQAALALLPRDYKPPLLILRYIYEKGIPVPENWIFTDGLKESSLSFWMYVLNSGAEEASNLLGLVLNHGDDKSKYLALAFYELVSPRRLKSGKRDVYQAMLIRFRFSPITNANVELNYNSMLKRQPVIGYHSTCALLDCRQYALLNRCRLAIFESAFLRALIGRMYRLNDDQLNMFTAKLVGCYLGAPKLLKFLILSKADDWHVQLVWNAIQLNEFHSNVAHYCRAPLETLKAIVFERDILPENVQKMLAMLDGFWDDESGKAIPREVHLLYTVMFWEASEQVISYFLAKVPRDYNLKRGIKYAQNMMRLGKYSGELLRMLTERCVRPHHVRWARRQMPRHGLTDETSEESDSLIPVTMIRTDGSGCLSERRAVTGETSEDSDSFIFSYDDDDHLARHIRIRRTKTGDTSEDSESSFSSSDSSTSD